MTDAARAAVEALANDCRRHTQSTEGGVCQECVVAFAAAQRAEEREACAVESVKYVDGDDPLYDAIATKIAENIRARHEGPG